MAALNAVAQKDNTRLVLDNILFATDFSPSSEGMLRYGLALARHFRGKIHVIPALAMDSVEAIDNEAKQRAFSDAALSAIQSAEELRRSGKLAGVRHEILVGGKAEQALPTFLRNQEFDLAISGIANRRGQTVVLHPAIEEVICSSQCPLLSIGSSFHQSIHGELKNILFATDFSPESLEASRYALSLAQEFQARLTLLHVVEGFEPKPVAEKVRASKPYKLWLGKLVPDQARLWSEVEVAVEFGRPAERILQVAWENHADLIVLGARGLDRLSSPGLNVSKVMSNAWCPVLTVSGVLESEKQERFWRKAAAASESQEHEILMEAV